MKISKYKFKIHKIKISNLKKRLSENERSFITFINGWHFDRQVVFAAVDLLKNDIDGVDKATISYFKKEHHFKEDLDPYFHIRWYKTPLLPRLEKFYTDFTEKWAKRFWNNIYDDTQKRVEL